MVDYDAVVVGSGPNGLAAAITLKRKGLSVLLIEAENKLGGGLRSESFTLPGFLHDVCATSHPMAQNSPFIKNTPLGQFGLEWIRPELVVTHPIGAGEGIELHSSIEVTARALGTDGLLYSALIKNLQQDWEKLLENLLKPISINSLSLSLLRFGCKGLLPATLLMKRFSTDRLKTLFAGMAGHLGEPLNNIGTSAASLILLASAHQVGWPIVRGGTQNLADSLVRYFTSMGGHIQTGLNISSLTQLPKSKIVIFDITPKQLFRIAKLQFSSRYQRQLSKYQYGPGTFKMDWALDDSIPFTHHASRSSGFVHLGGSADDILQNSKLIQKGIHSPYPFILLSQPSLFDPSRAPRGKHTAYAYIRVPAGSQVDYSEIIESQIERAAPGFRDRILARHSMDCKQLQDYNQNYVDGDILGGEQKMNKFFPKNVFFGSPYRTSFKGFYMCSASTHPGPGVHGMGGLNAANQALLDGGFL